MQIYVIKKDSLSRPNKCSVQSCPCSFTDAFLRMFFAIASNSCRDWVGVSVCVCMREIEKKSVCVCMRVCVWCVWCVCVRMRVSARVRMRV